MRRPPTGLLKTWWDSRKEFCYSVAIMAGIPVFLVAAAPYCC
jgi:hypothetical protein